MYQDNHRKMLASAAGHTFRQVNITQIAVHHIACTQCLQQIQQVHHLQESQQQYAPLAASDHISHSGVSHPRECRRIKTNYPPQGRSRPAKAAIRVISHLKEEY